MDLGTKNKRALVLASSQGLGLGIATQLCKEGANVLLIGRDETNLAAAAKTLTDATTGSATYAVVDLSAAEAAARLYASAQDKLARVDILVNNTGGPPPGTVDAPDTDSWRKQIDTMLIRIIEITNLCVADMKKSGWGRVLTVASSGVVQPISNLGCQIQSGPRWSVGVNRCPTKLRQMASPSTCYCRAESALNGCSNWMPPRPKGPAEASRKFPLPSNR